MRSLFRTFSLGLICLLLITSSDAAVNTYSYRIGRSIVTAQSVIVVTVVPGSFQTPDPGQGGGAFGSPSNTGVSTSFTVTGPGSTFKSCKWLGFAGVSGQIVSTRLKMNWSASGQAGSSGGGGFSLQYSLTNGGSWIGLVNIGGSSFSQSSSVDILLPNGQDLTQVQVRTSYQAGAGPGSSYSATASVSNIRLEVEVNCSASVPADRWKGEYYNGANPSGTPAMVRDDGAGFLDFNWGGGGPGSACVPGVDNFSARWTRTVNFASGTHRFTVTGDDGVRLYVDGQLKIDAWFNQGATTYVADVTLNAGPHEVKLEYFENYGAAVASLSWTDVTSCFANVPADRWKGEYYNNTASLSGAPWMVRDDGAGFLNFNFGEGSPHSFCVPGVDNFSARWTRMVNFAAGIYRFTASVDDGVRLYVDGQLRIDQWGNLPNTYTADVALSAGNHEVKLEFVEYTGGAAVSLSWADFTNCLANVPASKWRGEYYNNITLTGPVAMVRDDGAGFLNFDFGLGGPGGTCGLGVDNFSARWTRTVNFGSGVYRFSVTVDDGVRLYVDGQLKIDKWFSQGATTYTADVTLSAGAHEVKLEYFESGGPGIALLSWADPTGVNCLPNTPLPLISSVPQTGGKENIASTAPSQAPKRCGQKISD